MPAYTVKIGPLAQVVSWDTDDMDEVLYPDDSGDALLGTFYGLETTARIKSLGLDISGADADDPIVLENNVPIKWKTTAGAKRTMLKLNDNDIFIIGNDSADGANSLRFDIENIDNAMTLDAVDGLVFDDATSFIRLKHGSGPATPANGHIWTENTGVYAHIAGADILVAGASGAVTDHGALTGLSDDDHTQYLLANGSRGLSANWDAGSFEIRAETFESDVATGTAPFTISSTTKVTNLNADKVDGFDVSSFFGAVLDDTTLSAVLTTLGLDTDLATFALPGSTTISAYGATLVDDADAATARGTLGLGTIATQNSNNVSITGGAIDGTAIGGSTPAAGAFTTLSASSTSVLTGNVGIGATQATNFKLRVLGSIVAYKGTAQDFAQTTTDLGAFNSADNSRLFLGQSTSDYTLFRWVYNATVGNAYSEWYNNNNQPQYIGLNTTSALTIRGTLTGNKGINIPTGETYKLNGTQIGLANGLAGVLMSGPAAGHMLLYDDTDSRFENVAMSGDATITKAGVLSLAAGLSNKSLYTNSTRVGNLGAGEDDLMSYTVPAGTLANTNERLVIHGVFQLDTGGANRVKAYWNGVAVYDSGSVTPTAAYLSIRLTIIRTSASGQDIIIEVLTASTTHTLRVSTTTGTATLSGTVVVKFTGEDAGSTNDDVAQEWMSVDYIKTN